MTWRRCWWRRGGALEHFRAFFLLRGHGELPCCGGPCSFSAGAVLARDAARSPEERVVVERVAGVGPDPENRGRVGPRAAFARRCPVARAVPGGVDGIAADPGVDPGLDEAAGAPRVAMQHDQRLGAPDPDKVRAPEAVPSRPVPDPEGVADVSVTIVAVSNPVDRPGIPVGLLDVPVPKHVFVAVSVQVCENERVCV